MPRLPRIAMTPSTEHDYDPIPLILAGMKTHTLRKRHCHGRKEIVVKVNGRQQRTGIVVEFTKRERMRKMEFLDDDFARADGFRGSGAGAKLASYLLTHYAQIPSRMWCTHFKVIERPEENDEQTTETA